MNDYIDVLQSLPKDSVIVTPNRRLAVALHALYQQCRLEAGDACWQTPSILPINVWIDELWSGYARQTLQTLPHVLNAAQEQQLWESILSQSAYQDSLLQVSETSRLVKSARGLLKQWLMTTDHPLFETADDYAACKHWIKAFEATCENKRWTDTACLPDLVREQIEAGNISAPAIIYDAGFTSLSPQLTALFTAAATRGSKRHSIAANLSADTIHRTSAADHDDELRLCAQWAKMRYEENTSQSIACVIPLLDKNRDRVMQLFTEIFGNRELFNLSAGQPLAQYPVIRTALELLSLYKKQISSEALFLLLSTPFISGGETERIKRSQLDGRMRAKNFSSIDLHKQLEKDENTKSVNLARSCPILAKSVRAFKAILEDAEQTASYSYWAENFNQLLTALGWPGERVLNSEEYQVVTEWLKLLHDLTTLDITVPAVSFYQALQALTQMATGKPFQPQSPPATVQILGVLEASGLCFDHLWVAGMDDNSWPAQPKPNPFIPKKLQRELKMPHASAERELEYCQTMTQQFQSSAHHIIFSYARTQDENLVQPSPLIRTVTEIGADTLLPQHSPAVSEKIFQHKSMQQFIDDTAPAQQAGDIVTGGVEIIKNQALCPFKAFAECRLFARELESPLPGLRPKERGTIVHHIMEKIWVAVKDSEQLHAMSDNDLHALLEVIIHDAVLEHARALQHQNSYLALEKKRLHKLIFEWLNTEKQRGSFTVLNSEKSSEIQISKLKFNVRIDRIDALPDGKKLIIDYKTGTNLSVSDWFGDRPEEPQLPLYAQLDSTQTAGIAFAQIATGDACFKGVSQYTLDIKGIKPSDELRSADNQNWLTVTQQWQNVLSKLADDFYDGKACVDPKDQHATCQWCALKPLCRIQEYGGYSNDE